MSTTSFIISIQYVIIICNDVTRASINKDGQKLADYAFFNVHPRVRHNRGIKIGLL